MDTGIIPGEWSLATSLLTRGSEYGVRDARPGADQVTRDAGDHGVEPDSEEASKREEFFC
jgi:hypothetical protein